MVKSHSWERRSRLIQRIAWWQSAPKKRNKPTFDRPNLGIVPSKSVLVGPGPKANKLSGCSAHTRHRMSWPEHPVNSMLATNTGGMAPIASNEALSRGVFLEKRKNFGGVPRKHLRGVHFGTLEVDYFPNKWTDQASVVIVIPFEFALLYQTLPRNRPRCEGYLVRACFYISVCKCFRGPSTGKLLLETEEGSFREGIRVHGLLVNVLGNNYPNEINLLCANQQRPFPRNKTPSVRRYLFC